MEPVITASIAVICCLAGVIAWFYRRGRSEQALSNSVDRNTEATNLLAAQVGGLRDILQVHDHTLTEHHYRIKALEDRS